MSTLHEVTANSYKKRIADLEQQLAELQWISVEDRLPEEGTIVLVHWVDGFIDTARYRPYYVTNFTHWMKLPEPPQEQSK